MAFPNDWQYRKKLTISAADVDEDVNNFAYLVYLDSTNFDFSKCTSDGSDIRFTASDGITLLPFFREKHDSTNQVAIYHVKIPTVSSSSDTTLYLYYGNSSATDASSDFQTVFGDSGLVAYYPFDGNANDLSGNHNPTAIQGDIAFVNGYFPSEGVACTSPDTTPTSDYVEFPDGLFSNSDLTISYLAKANSISSSYTNAVIDNYNCGNQTIFASSISMNSNFSFGYGTRSSSSDNRVFVNCTSDVNTNEWYHVVSTKDDVNKQLKIAINGSVENTVTYSSTEVPSTPIYLFGWQDNCGSPNTISFDGIINQLRIYYASLSSTQVSLLYKMETKSLFTFGAEETIPQISGDLKDPQGNPVTVQCKVLAINPETNDVIATATSNTDGTFGINMWKFNVNVLFVAFYEGSYENMTDPVGVWLDII